MHPMAGPWLSPKVVTVNGLRMVLPDMVLCDFRGALLQLSRQLLARQQKHPAAAALELQPHAGQAREGPSHRALGVAHLDDQHAARTQMSARLLEDDAHR